MCPRNHDALQTTYTYDAFGRLTKTTSEGITLPATSTKASTSLTYNDAGEQIEVRTPLDGATTFWRYLTYDAAGRQITTRDAKGITTTTYNKAGWPTLIDDLRSTNVNMVYDFMGRLLCRDTIVCTSSNSTAERFAYDKASNLTQATSISSAPVYDLVYDDDGRLWKTKRNTLVETTYTYDPVSGELDSIADPAGTSTFTYNAAGQISTLDDPLTTGASLSTYTYDPSSGRLDRRLDAQANMRVNLTYESATGRLDTQVWRDNPTLSTLASFDLGYDAAGNVTSKTSDVFSNASDGTWTYQYDPAYRLTKATLVPTTGSTRVHDYAYDGVSNRTLAKQTTGGTVIQNWTTAFSNASLATTGTNNPPGTAGDETVTYTYDAAGITLLTADSNLTGKDWAYTYDEYSRLKCSKQATTCTSGATRVLLSTDAFNRTHQRTHSGTVTDHSYRGIGEDLVKTAVGSAATTYALTLGGSPLGQKVGTASPSYFLRDPHGDSVGLVSTAAANQGTTSYDPYGQVLSSSGTQPLFGYQSDITDVVTKQVDMGTRWYSPGQGRFSVRDVLWGDPLHPVSLNQWVYGAANPITMWDPTGMVWDTAPDNTACGTAECEAAVEEFIEIEEEDPGYFTENFQVMPEPAPPPPEPAVPAPVDERSWLAKGWDAAAGGVDAAWEGAKAVGRTAWHGTRAALNSPWTAAGAAYATWVQNADCDLEAELTVACYGADADGWRGGFTVGNTFITSDSEASDETLAHERNHSDQWAIFGGAFPVLYGIDYGQDEVFGNGDGCGQVFEIWADLEDGDYGC